MTKFTSRSSQRGATLVVGLILLTVITLMVVAAFTLSNTNLKSVGNMQFRNEAIAAANKATEQIIASDFTVSTASQEINVDLNNDGTRDYVVTVAPPVCIRASVGTDAVLSSVTLPGMSSISTWKTVWDIASTVTDPVSGAVITMHSAIRVDRTNTQKTAECP